LLVVLLVTLTRKRRDAGAASKDAEVPNGSAIRDLRGRSLAAIRARRLRPNVSRRATRAVNAQNSWFSPPKTSLTESSVKMRRIESVSSSAHESTRMVSGAPGRNGIVSVTTTCSKPDEARFS